MVINESRKLTEDEFYFAEGAFQEYRETGSTLKRCPWCSGKLLFKDGGSGHSITCDTCTLKISVRGI
jgi:hypothetical protein